MEKDKEMRKIITDYLSNIIEDHEFARRINNRYIEMVYEGLAEKKSGWWIKSFKH